MEFKNAVTVCLISFFSASLVVLIARSLDSQAAAKLQPELAQIAKELQTIRARLSGQKVNMSGSGQNSAAEVTDGLIVYYTHGSQRCPDCLNLEKQVKLAVETGFAEALQGGEIAWQTRNYEEPDGAFLRDGYNVFTPTVVLVWMKDGQIVKGKNLDDSFSLIKQGMDEKCVTYIQDEIRKMLAEIDGPATDNEPSDEEPRRAPANIPLPTS